MRYLHVFFSAAITCLLFASCSGNDAEESSSGSATNTATNYGDDTSDFVSDYSVSSTIHIVWSGTSATVTGSADGVTVSNSNGYVSVSSTAKNIEYAVSGEGTGQLSIYSDYKYQLSFEGLTLSCSDGPAVNSQSSKTCYAVISGTNTLTDGSSYASSTEDRKAAFFSEGQICFSGSGTLNVTGNYKHAVASDDYIRLCSGTGSINLTANGSDGLHANDGIIINDGTLTIHAAGEGIQCDTSSVVITGGTVHVTSGEKGILAYGNIEISGGTITAICSGSSSSSNTPEGIEAKGTITISGGYIYAQAYDDAINAAGDLTISGGYVMAYSTGNDGLDANGNCYIKGGVVYAIGASSPEVALDANTEGGKTLYVQGGMLVAIGGLENGASLSQTCYSTTASTNTWYALSGDNGTFAFKTPSSLKTTTMVVSTSGSTSLKSSVSASGSSILNGYAYSGASVSGGSSVTLSSYTGGNGGGPGGGPGGGGRPGER